MALGSAVEAKLSKANLSAWDPGGKKKAPKTPRIAMDSPSGANVIGGTNAAARNVISANGGGISLSSSENVIQGNFIGTDASGTIALGNALDGISFSTSTYIGNVIGGTVPGAGNVI